MPAYNGVNIFGTGVIMETKDRPRARQINSFFGLNGCTFIDGGSRGRVTQVEGVLVASSLSSLSDAEQTFRVFADGEPRTLIDTFGNAWTNVILEQFQPIGRIRQSAQGGFLRAYKAGFFHLQ